MKNLWHLKEKSLFLFCYFHFVFLSESFGPIISYCYAPNFEKVGSILVSACACVRASFHLFKKKIKLGF